MEKKLLGVLLVVEFVRRLILAGPGARIILLERRSVLVEGEKLMFVDRMDQVVMRLLAGDVKQTLQDVALEFMSYLWLD